MKIRVLSDLHLEFADFIVPAMDGDKQTILVLAGDITVADNRRLMVDTFIPFIERCSTQFKAVIYVFGNHESYDFDLINTRNRIEQQLQHSHTYNVHILENESVVIGDVAFIGATLWTDCGGDMPLAEFHWHGMSDSHVIKYNRGPFSLHVCRKIHKQSKEYLFKAIEEHKLFGRKTVVVTHHGVSEKSVHKMYKTTGMSELNKFFYSPLDLEFADANPDLIVSGHTHMAYNVMLDETICQTCLVCNPRGYAGYESPPESRGFNPKLLLEI